MDNQDGGVSVLVPSWLEAIQNCNNSSSSVGSGLNSENSKTMAADSGQDQGSDTSPSISNNPQDSIETKKESDESISNEKKRKILQPEEKAKIKKLKPEPEEGDDSSQAISGSTHNTQLDIEPFELKAESDSFKCEFSSYKTNSLEEKPSQSDVTNYETSTYLPPRSCGSETGCDNSVVKIKTDDEVKTENELPVVKEEEQAKATSVSSSQDSQANAENEDSASTRTVKEEEEAPTDEQAKEEPTSQSEKKGVKKGDKKTVKTEKKVKEEKKNDESSDDDEGDDKKNGKTKKSGKRRRNIREILTDDKLEARTIVAQKEEMERRKRLQEIQMRAQQEMLFKQQLQQRFMLQQQEQQQHQQQQWVEQQRAAAAAVAASCQQSLQPSISILPIPPKPVAPKVGEEVIEVKSSSSSTTTSSSSSSSADESDESSENESKRHLKKLPFKKNKKDVIDITSSSDNDDVVTVSDHSEPEEEEESDPNNSGSHTNDEFNQPDAQGRVLVNVGHPPEEPDIFLVPQCARMAKPHQIGGIRFLYDNVIESVERFKASCGFGCILAHSMGLGKTFQIVSFVDIFLRITGGKSALIIVPINTIQNWVCEFNMWIPLPEDVPSQLLESGEVQPRNFQIYVCGESLKTHEARAKVLTEWSKLGGVLLIGYEMYRMLALCKNLATKPKKKKGRQDLNLSTDPESEKQNKELLEAIQQALVRPGPDLVICDEGHRIKNSHASTSQALKNIRTKRRIVLTGYPLQNNLIEYWCMVDFVRPNYLGTRAEFSNMFERPIQNGQCLDSTPQDVRLMRFRAHVLHSLLEGFVQRRGHSVLQLTLPRKDEHVLLIRMTPIQRQLYRTFMQELLQRNSVSNPIRAFAMCCKIWNHPDIMYNCLRDLKDDEDLDIEEVTNTKSGETIQNKTKPSSSKAPPQDDQEVTITPLPTRNDNALTYEWANLLMKDYQPGILENSLKMLLMFVIVEQSLAVGDRILLFSQSLFTLTIIEEFLGKHNVPGRFNERWAKGKSYFRLDGGTSAMEREKLITEFNNNPNIHLFLISTRAGSLGINLVGANRVIVFDASWNPCHDTQAMCRVYRYGQVKPCFVYRLVTDNSLEKKIYDRQVNKQGMADRVVDELNPDANLTTKDINNLICVNEEDPGPKDLAFAAEKYSDNVLQHICQHFSHCITKEPFEHESLLIDRKDKKLTKSEKRLARQSYEMEKRSNCNFNRSNYSQRPYGPFGTKFEGGAYGNYANRYGATNVRPSQSTPVPMHPRGLGANYSQEALARQGIFYQQVTVQNEVVIPTSTGDGPPIRIPAGQQVLVVKSPRGIYIRTQDNKIIAIRNPAAVTGGGDVTAAVGTGANNSTTSSVTITPINSSSVSSAGTNILTGASLLSAANNAKQANIAAKNKGIVISSSLPTQKNISLQSQASQLSASNASKKPLGNKDPEIIDLCDADDEEDVLVTSSQPVTSKAVSSSPSGNFYASYTGTSNCSAYSSPHGNRVSSCNPNLLAGGSLYGAGVGPLASPTAAATTTTTTTTTSSSSLPSSTSSKCTASPPATTTVSSSSNSSVMSSVGNMSAGVNSNKNSGNNTPYNSSYSSNSGIPYTSSNTDNCATSYNNNSNNGNNNNSSNFFSNKDNNVPYTNRSSNNSSANNPVSYASNNAGNTPYNNSNSSSIPYSIATNSGTSSYSNSSSAPYNSSNANIPYGGNDTSNTSSSVPYGNNSTNQYSNHNPSYNTMPSSSTQNTPIGNLNQSLMGLGIGNAAASNNTPMPPHLSGNCNMGTRPPLGPPMNSMGAMNNMAPNLNSSVPSMSGMNPIHGASHNGPMDSNPDSSFSISQLLASNSMQPPSGSSLASGGLPVSAMDYLNQTLSTMPGEQGPTSGISQLSFLNSIPGLLPPGNQHHPSSMHSSSSQSPYSPGCSSGPMGPPSQMFTAGPLAVHHLGSLYSHLMSPNQLLPGYREDKPPPPPPPQHMHMGDGGLSLSKYDFHSNRHRAGQ